jgi:hypothetical protein
MKKIIFGVLLGFSPLLANCASSVPILSVDFNINEYQGLFQYSEQNKDKTIDHAGVLFYPNEDGLDDMLVFNPIVYNDKKSNLNNTIYLTTGSLMHQGKKPVSCSITNVMLM